MIHRLVFPVLVVVAVVTSGSEPFPSVCAEELPGAAFNSANHHYVLGHYEQAIELYRQEYEAHPFAPSAPEILLLIGRSYSRLDQWTLAEAEFQRLLEHYAESEWADDALYEIGMHYAQRSSMLDARRSIGAFHKLLALYPKGNMVFQTRLRLGETYVLLKRFGEAEKHLQELAHVPLSRKMQAILHFDLGRLYSHVSNPRRDLAKSIEHYQRIVSEYPESTKVPAALFALGNCYRSMQRWDDALEHFQTVVDHHPGSLFGPFAQSNIGLCYKEKKEYSRSVESLKSLLRDYALRPKPASQDITGLLEHLRKQQVANTLKVSADSMDYDKTNQIATYSGSVKIVRNDTAIDADTASVDLSRYIIEASGNLRLQGGETVDVRGNTLRYNLREEEVLFQGQVRAVQQKEGGRESIIEGERILYRIRQNVLEKSEP